MRKGARSTPFAACSISASSASRGGPRRNGRRPRSVPCRARTRQPLQVKDRKSLRAHARFVPPQLHRPRCLPDRGPALPAVSPRFFSRQGKGASHARLGLAWRGSLSDRAIRKQTSMPRLIAAAPASGRPAPIACRSRRVLPTPVCTARQPACTDLSERGLHAQPVRPAPVWTALAAAATATAGVVGISNRHEQQTW
jgi:hypothetical protein